MTITHTISGRVGGLENLDEVRYAALFELDGHYVPPRELLDALRDERWNHAAGVLLATPWAKKLPQMAGRLARQLATGEPQGRA